jgi:Tol biopolymer transport system component
MTTTSTRHAPKSADPDKESRVNRLLVALLVLAVVASGACAENSPTAGSDTSTTTSTSAPTGPPGPIVFQHLVGAGTEDTDLYSVNPDGSDARLLFSGPAQLGRWSPDGTEIAIFCCGNGMVAHVLDAASGELREFPAPDPTLETHCGFAWSPDGERLACETFGIDDPTLNGIYSIRTSDGGDLTRITSNPGGEDIAGDYSPDGSQMVFVRFEDEQPVGFFVTNVDGSGLRQLTPDGMLVDEDGFGGRWSPDGRQILVVARAEEGHHKAIWVVDANGGEPELLAMTPACGGRLSDPGTHGCYSPSWSPDGSQIVFARSDADGGSESIYLANADGSDVVQLTEGEDDHPAWGTPPR